MSAALVRKSLALVDPSFNTRKNKGPVDFLPNDKKFAKNIQKKQNKHKTRDLPTKTKKLTVKDLQHTLKSKNEILQRNLKKLELIKKICTIDLSSEVTSQLFERASCWGFRFNYDDNIFKMGTPIGLLLFLGFLGFIFIGFLSMYTLYMLYVGDGNIKVRKHNKFLYG
ncbi:Active regulator of SIRT1, or 40S ribosomal protein S19-binding 1 [Popillia japonica]|uniref:Active regulator of SIRT1, or 40S ribosomal protein S19-binding 1 n=1 Tax=Popillia japonica TaxID=7064 RepID=A0AAW1JEI7_POPJA